MKQCTFDSGLAQQSPEYIVWPLHNRITARFDILQEKGSYAIFLFHPHWREPKVLCRKYFMILAESGSYVPDSLYGFFSALSKVVTASMGPRNGRQFQPLNGRLPLLFETSRKAHEMLDTFQRMGVSVHELQSHLMATSTFQKQYLEGV